MKSRVFALLICTVLVFAGLAQAQTSVGQISGTVTDPSKAVIPGAKVVVKNQGTGATHETTTTSAGTFVVAALPPGQYSVTVTSPGFQTFTSVNNTLTVGAVLVIDAPLKVGSASEVVQVESSYEKLETTNATLSGVVDRKTVAELPLNGRNPLNLIVLEPGLVQRPGPASEGSGTHVFGSRDRAHNVTVDGIDANESSVPNPQSNLYRLTPDNVQEYRVVTHNPTAEFGRNSGSNVAVATRQGTNEFHGDAYYFHRNTVLNSNEFFNNASGNERPTLLLHQFGGDVGGPVIKNRTFFFFSYQGNRIKQTQPISQSFGIPVVYTQMAKAGNFRYVKLDPSLPSSQQGVLIPGTTTRVRQNDRRLLDSSGNILAGVPICAAPTDFNCIATYNIFANDPAGIGSDPIMAQMIAGFPFPNSFNTVGDGLNTAGFAWNPPSQFTGPFFLIRGDHKFNDNHNIFARMLWNKYDTTKGDFLNARPATFPGFNPQGEVSRTGQSLAISYRAVLSPRMVNEFTTGYSRFNFFFALNEANKVSGALAAIGQECFGTDSLSNIDTPYCNTTHTARAVSTIQFIDNLSYTRGAHTWKTGFNFRFYRHNDSRGVPGGFNGAPTIVFSRSTRSPTGNTAPGVAGSWTNLPATNTINSTDRNRILQGIVELAGIPALVQQVFQADLGGDVYTRNIFTLGTRIKQFDSYIQDEWKMRRNLTLTYGVRWEWKQPAKDCCNRTFVPDRDVLGSQGPVTFVPADSWWGRDNANAFAPRLSLAWDPWSDGKTVIRAGWGIAFDTISTFQVTAIGGKVPGTAKQCFTTVPFGSSPAAPPSGCADLRGIITTNARVGQVLSALTSGGVFQQPLPTATPSQSFFQPAQRTNNAPGVGAFQPNMKVPTVHEWNLTIQRELPWGFTAQVGYIGKRGMRLFRAYDINQIRTNQPGFLSDFLIGQANVFAGCDPDGTVAGSSGSACATAVGVPSLLYTLAGCAAGTDCSLINGRSSDFTSNGLGDLAANIDATSLAAASVGFFRPNPQFGQIFYIDSGGSSIYHGFLAQVNRRFQKGLTLNFAYTMSKSIDDQSVDPVSASSGGGLSTTNSRTVTDVRNFRLDRTVSDFDNRHVVVANVLYELPFGRGRQWASNAPGWADQIIGGWTLTSIYTWYSGEPFTLNSGARTVNNTHVSTVDVRGPFLQPGLFNIDGVDGPVVYNVGPLLNTAADFGDPDFNCRHVLRPDDSDTGTLFCIPAPGQQGNSGRNSVYGPGFWNVDIGILKNFRLTEQVKLQFRTEFFNAFNHANFANPRVASDGSPTLTSSLFGQTCCVASSVPSSTTIIANGEPNRVIQFALKIQF